jgi:hypothetical protein
MVLGALGSYGPHSGFTGTTQVNPVPYLPTLEGFRELLCYIF